ncbi:kinase-like domain-containing protein [Limtongia smithiae]|uniref:kinase-like domain-containing protein n=1 Tax=Limtongia smithiae TaxID=1125753 RepID=UPI0034CFACE4
MPPPSSPALAQAAARRIGSILDHRLKLTSVLGVGAYGVVYSAIDIVSHVPYAIKTLLRNPATGMPLANTQSDVLFRETSLLMQTHLHRNIISVVEVIDRVDGLYVVMEYCPEGDLFFNITEKKLYVGNDELVRSVFLQIVAAVQYCHANGVYHRDLKPENILVCDGGATVKLSDFGLATIQPVSFEYGCGSSFYMSPECYAPTDNTGYDVAANDVWSLGVILINLTCGRNPWKTANRDSDESFKAFLRSPTYLQRILPISVELNDILARMFDANPKTRISLSELYQRVAQCRQLTLSSEDYARRLALFQQNQNLTSYTPHRSAAHFNKRHGTITPAASPSPAFLFEHPEAAVAAPPPAVVPPVPPVPPVTYSNGLPQIATPAATPAASGRRIPPGTHNPFRNRMVHVYIPQNEPSPLDYISLQQQQPPQQPQQPQRHDKSSDGGLGIFVPTISASEKLQQALWASSKPNMLLHRDMLDLRPLSVSSVSTVSSTASPRPSSPSHTPATSISSMSPRSCAASPFIVDLDHTNFLGPPFVPRHNAAGLADIPSDCHFEDSCGFVSPQSPSPLPSSSVRSRQRKLAMAKIIPRAGNAARQRRRGTHGLTPGSNLSSVETRPAYDAVSHSGSSSSSGSNISLSDSSSSPETPIAVSPEMDSPYTPVQMNAASNYPLQLI